MAIEQAWYGNIEIDDTSAIVAGSYITKVLTYEVGKYGMDNGGRVRVLFRYVTDAGIPQVDDPKADNYVCAFSSNSNAILKGRYIPKGGYRPWMHSLEFELGKESLDEGEKIYIVIGDTSHGSRGYKAQTFIESSFTWKVEVENFETGVWVPLENCPITPIISEEPQRAVLLAPSFSPVGESLHGNIKVEDQFGNAAPYSGEIQFSLEQIDAEGIVLNSRSIGKVLTGLERGYSKTDSFVLGDKGYYRLSATVTGIKEKQIISNPIIVDTLLNENRHYWGDFHVQFNNSTGVGSVSDGFTYARDASAISFVGHQPNDFLLTEEGWQEAKAAVKEFHNPGEFIPILGYEWSGITPKGGDRNVHFLEDDGPLHRTSHWQVADKTDIDMDRYDLNELYKTLEKRDDVLIVPHVGGRRCDITKYFHEGLEKVVEICSTHGRFQWLLEEALDNNYTVGVVGGSDDHTGRPGLSYPTNEHFGTRGGLAGVFMDKLDRKSIFDAVKLRHTYATTGERIALYVNADDLYVMGDQWNGTEAPLVKVQTAGTKPLESVEIYRNKELAFSYPLYKTKPVLKKLRIEWGGAKVKGRSRHSNWDGWLSVEGGTIQKAECFAFDHPKQGITHQSAQRIEWRSNTSGDHDGILLTIDGDENTIITFHTPHGSEKHTLGDIYKNPIHKDCGFVDQYYSLAPHYEELGPQIVNFEWKDANPLPGRNAYWIKVVQEDGETAWSSPLYFMKQ